MAAISDDGLATDELVAVRLSAGLGIEGHEEPASENEDEPTATQGSFDNDEELFVDDVDDAAVGSLTMDAAAAAAAMMEQSAEDTLLPLLPREDDSTTASMMSSISLVDGPLVSE